MSTDLIRNFPEISQSDTLRKDVAYEFSSTQDVYFVTKGPATRVFEIRSGATTFSEGTDYSLVENTRGDILKIDWGIGGTSPDDGDTFIVDQEFRSVISRYLASHDDEFNRYSADLEEITEIRQLKFAKGEELDRIGELFGRLGQRSDRTDSDYRSYLASVVRSFNGRGSRAGLKFAVAASVGTTADNIEIIENQNELEYTLRISNVDTAFIAQSINELADLADPSGVLLDDAIIILEGNTITVEGSSTSAVNETTGLGGGTLDMDGTKDLG
jgi:hypothetical protein